MTTFLWALFAGLCIAYMLYSAVLLYHWMRYSWSKGAVALSLAAHVVVSLFLFSLLLGATLALIS